MRKLLVEKVFIGCDHAGFNLKNILITFIKDTLKLAVEDLGILLLLLFERLLWFRWSRLSRLLCKSCLSCIVK